MPLLKKKLYSTVFLVLCFAFSVSAQTSNREYQVKAAFLFNFTHFVEWPANSFTSPQAPLTIGILGTDPFGNYLKDLVKSETIGQHPLTIKHFATIEEVSDCHILFINVSDKKSIPAVIETLKGKNILTVSDINRFAKSGGMIRLYTEDDKINIEINFEEVKAEGLTISSKLLKLSKIVKTDKK